MVEIEVQIKPGKYQLRNTGIFNHWPIWVICGFNKANLFVSS